MTWSLLAVVCTYGLSGVLAAAQVNPKLVINVTVGENLFLPIPSAAEAETTQTVEWNHSRSSGLRSIAKVYPRGNNPTKRFGDYLSRVDLQPDGSLRLLSARLSDAGEYSCVTTDQSGQELTRSFTVYVSVTGFAGWPVTDAGGSDLSVLVPPSETNGCPVVTRVDVAAFSAAAAALLVMFAIIVWVVVRCRRSRSTGGDIRKNSYELHEKETIQNDDTYESMGRVP
ncbi:uncharacterized protein LOC103184824 [Callorhinchus milii]|uniref:uncharacterized protein LOC103184824 n=1 Tax=Callorhinchus milii TaxID=7868 RepID=UPI001C3FB0AA|nr:uncharacterized protein LOC103184824 [Callorhinchus milii]